MGEAVVAPVVGVDPGGFRMCGVAAGHCAATCLHNPRLRVWYCRSAKEGLGVKVRGSGVEG